MNYLRLLILILSVNNIMAQEKKLPYYEIPEHSDIYTVGTVTARMIDGLGFRYYWATEGLRDEDLKFKPSEDARTTEQTIDHILGLSNVIVNTVIKKQNEGGRNESELSFSEKREKTLLNLKTAADILREANDLTEFKIVFKNDKGTVEYPFWNNINGPIEDAVWHCGQIVSFRRSSGNPFNSKASLFRGKLRN